MTVDGDGHHHSDPPTVVRVPAAAPVVLVVQVLALLGLIGYAVIGLLLEAALDTRVIVLLGAFGLGVRPATIGDIIRRASSGDN